MTTQSTAPAASRALVTHGFASSWEHGWVQHGWPDLLREAGIEAVPFALPGHAGSNLPPAATVEEITASALGAARGAELAVGFSMGSAVTLHAAAAAPEHFRTIVLLGFGDHAWPYPGELESLAARVEDPTTDDAAVVLLQRAAASAGNDLASIAEFLRHFPGPPPRHALRHITGDVLLVLGERDALGPATLTAAALPNARVVILPGVDHVRTPSSPAAMTVVLDALSRGREHP